MGVGKKSSNISLFEAREEATKCSQWPQARLRRWVAFNTPGSVAGLRAPQRRGVGSRVAVRVNPGAGTNCVLSKLSGTAAITYSLFPHMASAPCSMSFEPCDLGSASRRRHQCLLTLWRRKNKRAKRTNLRALRGFTSPVCPPRCIFGWRGAGM